MKSAKQCLWDYSIDIMSMQDDFNSQLFAAMERYAEGYHADKIGMLKEGEHPDEINPRAETWLDERRNWHSEVESLRNKINEQDLIITVIEEGSEAWKAEYDNCRSLLTALVELKHEKDTNGKTEWYLSQQPKVWEAAKKFLESYQHGNW